jgi:predicted dehydrogenase
MVNIGVIGLGSVWETRYRPALGRLGQRLRVRAVYDPVAGRAELTAAEHRTVAEGGLLALARRPDVDALLLLDTAWYGCEALRLLCSAAKPIYIAADLGDEPSMLLAMHWTAVSFGLTLMPELGNRYTPASNRLQELIATRLGRPKHIRLCVDGGGIGLCSPDFAEPDCAAVQAVRRSLVGWFDWLRYVFRTSPVSLSVEAAPAQPVIRIEYAPPRSSDVRPVAEIRVLDHADQPDAPQIGRPEVECEHGVAVIHTPTIIRWKADGEADFVLESLLSDRSETEVMLDHFCRRVVGGLIPVADLADISRSLELIQATRESARSGEPVALNGQAASL